MNLNIDPRNADLSYNPTFFKNQLPNQSNYIGLKQLPPIKNTLSASFVPKIYYTYTYGEKPS